MRGRRRDRFVSILSPFFLADLANPQIGHKSRTIIQYVTMYILYIIITMKHNQYIRRWRSVRVHDNIIIVVIIIPSSFVLYFTNEYTHYINPVVFIFAHHIIIHIFLIYSAGHHRRRVSRPIDTRYNLKSTHP